MGNAQNPDPSNLDPTFGIKIEPCAWCIIMRFMVSSPEILAKLIEKKNVL